MHPSPAVRRWLWACVLLAACGRSALPLGVFDSEAPGAGAGGRNGAGGVPSPGACLDDGGGARPLALTEVGPLHVASDDTHVYWTNGMARTVSRVALCGGEVEILASNVAAGPIAAGGGAVFWAEISSPTRVFRWAAAEGVSELWQPPQRVWGLDADDARLVGAIVDGPEAGLWRIDHGDGTPAQLYAGGVAQPVALDGDVVWFFAQDGDGRTALARVNVDGSGLLLPAVEVTLPSGVGTLAPGADHLYWGQWSGGGALMRAAPGGVAEQLVVTPGGPVVGAGFDGQNAYWTEQWEGRVRAWSVADGSVTTIATGQPTVEHLTLVPRGVAWVNFADGSVWAAPRL